VLEEQQGNMLVHILVLEVLAQKHQVELAELVGVMVKQVQVEVVVVLLEELDQQELVGLLLQVVQVVTVLFQEQMHILLGLLQAQG
jgi:hypothetical protein